MSIYQPKDGLFITFEGIDGCGKTLLAQKTAAALKKQGYKVLETKEPGGSPLGKYLRQMLLKSKAGSVMQEAETLLFLADRAQHCGETIIPALEEGQIVICDRFTDSTLAYQGGGRKIEMNLLKNLNHFASLGLKPQYTFYLKISLAEAQKRRDAQSDRMEQENAAFFNRVAEVYEGLAEAEPERIITLDAHKTPAELLARVMGFLTPALKK